MRPVERDEIVDYQTYEGQREDFRRQVMQVKEPRRVHVGEYLTFLFENRDTVRYQVQEMMRAEKIVKETEIRRELETYNELLGGPGALGCTLLIEVEDPALRDVKLREWLELPRHIYVKLADGRKVQATFDPRQVGQDRVSSVQFLQFDTRGELPEALGSDLPQLTAEATFTQPQRQALADDLKP